MGSRRVHAPAGKVSTRSEALTRRLRPVFSVLAALLIACFTGVGAANAQRIEDSQEGKAAAAAKAQAGFGALQGRWVRPDGGYVIDIRAVDAAGKLEASYANPRPLPFAVAQASREGGTLKLFFELRAGGYNGSTYTLTYDPGKDILKGVYFQAVMGQSFDVNFVRAR
jgi:hypothetical protein